jgi:hypothetical protein
MLGPSATLCKSVQQEQSSQQVQLIATRACWVAWTATPCCSPLPSSKPTCQPLSSSTSGAWRLPLRAHQMGEPALMPVQHIRRQRCRHEVLWGAVGAAPCRTSGTIQGKALRPPLVEHAPAAHSLEQLQPLCGRASASKQLPVLLSSLFRPHKQRQKHPQKNA